MEEKVFLIIKGMYQKDKLNKNYMILIYLIILFLMIIIFHSRVNASINYLKLENKQLQGQYIGEKIEYLEDTRRVITIKDIISGEYDEEFIHTNDETLSFGYSTAHYWFRFNVLNNTEKTIRWYLECAYPIIDKITLYAVDNNKILTKIMSGRYAEATSDKHELFDHVTHLFPLKADPGRTTYYLEIESLSPILVPLRAWSLFPLFKYIKIQTAIMLMLLGIMLIMLLYNLIIYLSGQERTYLFYAVHTFSLIVQFVFMYGYGYHYLWKKYPVVEKFGIIVIMVSTITGIQFTRSYLSTRINTPLFDSNYFKPLLFVITAITIIYYPLYYVIFDGKLFLQSITQQFSMVLVLISILSGFAAGLIYTVKRIRVGYYYLTAYMVFLSGACVYSLKDFGILPQVFITQYGVIVGAVSMLLLFSLGLGDRIHRMKDELFDLNVNLEQKVEQRTEELSLALKELEEAHYNLSCRQRVTEKELILASNIQKSLYPENPPESDYWDVAYFFEPFDRVSGDLFDFYEKDGDLKGVSLFDISGHGVSAGLITTLVKSIANRNFHTLNDKQLSWVINSISNDLEHELRGSDAYVTGIILRFDNDVVEYVNAAHPKLLMARKKSGKVVIVEPRNEEFDGRIMGIEAVKGAFKTLRFKVEPGDIIFLHTDGLAELKNENGDEYNLDRVTNILIHSFDVPTALIKETIQSDIQTFKGNATVNDDITYLVLKRQ